MPIQVAWHSQITQTIHLRYGGMLTGRDYIDAVDTIIELMRSREEPIHILVERMEIVPETPSPLSILFYANKNFPPNLGIIVLIKPSTYARTILTIAHSVTPHLVKNLHYVDQYEEALLLIEERIASSSMNESDE